MAIVYVLNKRGKPLMPTTRCGHVARLLKQGLAVPVSNNPFTIRLKYETSDGTQPLILGIDPGRTNIGVAAVKENGECVFPTHAENQRVALLNRGTRGDSSLTLAEFGSRLEREAPTSTPVKA